MGRLRPTVLLHLTLGLFATWLAGTNAARAQSMKFVRGDANVDEEVDITDGIVTLEVLFLGQGLLPCEDAADSNDDGSLDLSDPINTLFYIFVGEGGIPSPAGVCGTDPTPDPLSCLSFNACEQDPPGDTELRRVGHVLNRIAYGPTLSDVEHVLAIGVDAYVQEQLNPETIDETTNTALTSRLDALLEERQPSTDEKLVSRASAWKFFRGTTALPLSWNTEGYDDGAWETGVTSIGYSDGDDNTILDDMRNGYASVFLRKTFEVTDLSTIDNLILSVNYDDGFVAYLNGIEVARSANMQGRGTRPGNTVLTNGNHEAGGFEDFDISSRKGLLKTGTNLLAVQAHNGTLGSSDLTINPELVSRTFLPGDPLVEYPSIEEVKASIHVRGIYSRRQLQVVLADFWENHFTTDYDKVVAYLDELQNSDANDAMSEAQARREAANLEAMEYEFFLENALGNFGDLLRHSATSPTMLIYLDNVLNFAGNANENYSREILELHTHGVDNGYTQKDIEELARVFTGWNICKVAPEDVGDPFATCGVQFQETVLLDLGPGWKYFKGQSEPSPGSLGEATTGWTEVGFDDDTWLSGSTGIGYGDGDDATNLTDMRYQYASVYLRRSIVIPDPGALHNLLLEIEYDDGFVAYLNGVEVARSQSMEDAGSPPPFDETSDGHEVDEGIELFNLSKFAGIIQAGENVLAIQVHNTNLSSSDLSCLPRLVDREILPGSIENGDPNGAWTFHFLAAPDEHDFQSSKNLFPGKPYALFIPSNAGGTPQEGLDEAMDVIDTLVTTAPTAQYISTKLIEKFVTDDVDRVPGLLASCIGTWISTQGNIREVMNVILTSDEFWSEEAYRAKVKTPLEIVNSSIRALNGSTTGRGLDRDMNNMGMSLLDRDDPDGWSEIGSDWISTSGFLNRIKFVQDLTSGSGSQLGWQTQSFLDDAGIETAEEIVDFFNDFLYEGTLKLSDEQLLIEFLTTDNIYNPQALNPAAGSYAGRVDTGVSLMLSLPQWNFQ